MMEEMPVDESGKIATLSLGEYKLPTMMDIPPFRTVLVEIRPGHGPLRREDGGRTQQQRRRAGAGQRDLPRGRRPRSIEFPVTSERVYAALAKVA